MKEVKKLANAMSGLENRKGAVININIPVCGQAYFDCIRLNELLEERTDINFTGLCQPHVTLKMGRVKNLDDLQKILEILKNCFADFHCGTLHAQPVILKNPAQNYYFCEIKDERLMKVSQMLDEKIGSIMEQSKHPISKDNLHHITIGYRFDDVSVCRKVLGETISDFEFDRVCVSLAGEHGVALGSLRTFMLKID